MVTDVQFKRSSRGYVTCVITVNECLVYTGTATTKHDALDVALLNGQVAIRNTARSAR